MIVGARSGCSPAHLAALLQRQRGQPGEDLGSASARSAGSRGPGPGRRGRAPGRSPPARWRSRPRRSPRSTGCAGAPRARRRPRICRTSSASSSRSASGGGSSCRWRSVWRTTPAWVETWKLTSVPVADHHLGRAAADVEHQRGRPSHPGRARWSRPGRSAAPPRRRSGRGARGRSAARPQPANSSPLAESRTALVRTARRRSQPWRSICSWYSSSVVEHPLDGRPRAGGRRRRRRRRAG